MSKQTNIEVPSKYVYDNGFGPRHYICSNCGSRKLVQKQMGGFSPPRYDCDDCGEEVLSPSWETLEDINQLSKLQQFQLN